MVVSRYTLGPTQSMFLSEPLHLTWVPRARVLFLSRFVFSFAQFQGGFLVVPRMAEGWGCAGIQVINLRAHAQGCRLLSRSESPASPGDPWAGTPTAIAVPSALKGTCPFMEHFCTIIRVNNSNNSVTVTGN